MYEVSTCKQIRGSRKNNLNHLLNFTYEKIIEEKEIYEILSNLSLNLENNLKFNLSKKRKSYIKYFNKLNNDLMKLVSGINLSHLII